MLLPMSIGVLALMLALAGNFVYWAIYSIVNQGMSAAPVLRLFLLAMPGFAVQGVPAGVILAVCLVLNRAVRDNEITALRVAGASLPRVLTPFLFMALIASLLDWVVVEKVAPITNDLAKKTLYTMMSRAPEKIFQNDMYFRAGQYCFYVGSVDPNTHVLNNVMVYVRAESGIFGSEAGVNYPTVIIAKTAQEDKKKPNRWVFRDGVMHSYADGGRLTGEAPFQETAIYVGRELSTYWADAKDPFSMNSGELSSKIKDLSDAAFDPQKLQEMRVEYHRRFALAFACFVMALVAAPLALRFAKHGSFAGLVLAFALAFFWQGFDGWFRALGLAGKLMPFVAAWLTNFLFLVAGAFLLWRER